MPLTGPTVLVEGIKRSVAAKEEIRQSDHRRNDLGGCPIQLGQFRLRKSMVLQIRTSCSPSTSYVPFPKDRILSTDLDMANNFFHDVFGNDIAPRVMSGIIALSIFGDIVAVTFTASRGKDPAFN